MRQVRPPRPTAAALLAVAMLSGACALGTGVAPGPVAAADRPTAATTSTTTTTTLPATTTTTAAVPVTTTTTTAPVPEDVLRSIGANEAGVIPVLQYHLIEEPEDRWARTPSNLRADVERLIAAGFYPITAADLAMGRISAPAGTHPVVLTFDDSSGGQCRYRSNGTPDPDSACGILLAAAEAHPDAWAPIATFFVLLEVDVPDRILFGQPEWIPQKLQDMHAWGMEIGSHTVSHYRLDSTDTERVRWQLANAENLIEEMVPGHEVRTLAAPLGIYPESDDILREGTSEGLEYDLNGVFEVSGPPSPSPHTTAFDRLHIPRIQATQNEIDYLFSQVASTPDMFYVSDGDPETVSIPDTMPASLVGVEIRQLPDRYILQVYASN